MEINGDNPVDTVTVDSLVDQTHDANFQDSSYQAALRDGSVTNLLRLPPPNEPQTKNNVETVQSANIVDDEDEMEMPDRRQLLDKEDKPSIKLGQHIQTPNTPDRI